MAAAVWACEVLPISALPTGWQRTTAAVSSCHWGGPDLERGRREPPAQPSEGERVTVLDCPMSRLEQFEIDPVVRYPGRRYRSPECGRTEIQVVLVPVTGVDPDRAQ